MFVWTGQGRNTPAFHSLLWICLGPKPESLTGQKNGAKETPAAWWCGRPSVFRDGEFRLPGEGALLTWSDR